MALHEFDKSFIRKTAVERNIPITEFILNTYKKNLKQQFGDMTLLGVCPNSISVVRSALRSAKQFNAPLLFVATLNQVDLDGGYTGWKQQDLIRVIQKESAAIGFEGPMIVALDHGGPWLKDKQAIEDWDLDRAMEWVKKSITACLEAGYDLLHIDTTVDKNVPKGKVLDVEIVVKRTLELIEHAEKERREKGLPKISYEVGTEEVTGGFTDSGRFKKFLSSLKEGLAQRGLADVWPIFVVGNVGTDLHTARFDPEKARALVKVAGEYGSYVKGHYTDYVINPQDYPKAGIGGANVGPEFSQAEFDSLDELVKRNSASSNFIDILAKEIVDSNRWKKWLTKEEVGKEFYELDKSRQRWLLQTCSRYVWTRDNVVKARAKLYEDLRGTGVDGEEIVLQGIDSVMNKYFSSFNLEHSVSRIEHYIKEEKR